MEEWRRRAEMTLFGMLQCEAVVAPSVGCGALCVGAFVVSMAVVRRAPGQCGGPPWRC
jgi:hypothetical protein